MLVYANFFDFVKSLTQMAALIKYLIYPFLRSNITIIVTYLKAQHEILNVPWLTGSDRSTLLTVSIVASVGQFMMPR
jgi:hypothetical protein